ncbi:MAG: calcium/sodium antiporter [Paludibacteraceae bacterium]|nr:calcium/sodium antiporter [Paludibacteraceae bacterium]
MDSLIESLLAYGWWVGALFIVLGFVALVKGADWLVDGASAIAKRSGISDLIIGLTVVAFGTSMPEFVVNMVSVAEGTTDLAITNILGSNIINTFVILGLTALVYPIASQKRSRDFDIPLSIIAGVLVFAFVVIHMPFGEQEQGIGRMGGIVLLLFFSYFLYNTFRHAKDHPDEMQSEETQMIEEMSTRRAICLILVGFVGLVVGGELIVKSAVDIATRCGVSEAIIGLTVVALGTSLPELATSVIAATKKNCDIALGNVIGSNIFNVFFVLGCSAVVRPLPAYEGIIIDAWMAALGSMLVWLFVKTNHEREIKRWGGAILLLIYAGYLTYRLMTL